MGMTDWISSANVSCTTMYPPAAIGFARHRVDPAETGRRPPESIEDPRDAEVVVNCQDDVDSVVIDQLDRRLGPRRDGAAVLPDLGDRHPPRRSDLAGVWKSSDGSPLWTSAWVFPSAAAASFSVTNRIASAKASHTSNRIGQSVAQGGGGGRPP